MTTVSSHVSRSGSPQRLGHSWRWRVGTMLLAAIVALLLILEYLSSAAPGAATRPPIAADSNAHSGNAEFAPAASQTQETPGTADFGRNPLNPRRIHGRIVDVQGIPRRGCVAGIELIGRHGFAIAPTHRATMRVARTDEEGRFAIDTHDIPPDRILITIHDLDPWLTPRLGVVHTGETPERATQGADIDLGVITVFPSGELRGGIRWSDGRQVQGGRLHLEHVLPLASGQFRPQGIDVATVAITEGGQFALAWPIRAGRWKVRVDGLGDVVAAPATLEVSPGSAARQIDIQVVGTLMISGHLCDASGAPAVGVRLVALDGPTGDRVSETSLPTTADGAFIVRPLGPPDLDRPVRLRLAVAGSQPWPNAFRWGDANVKLELPATSMLELEVLDAETGAPVETYGCSCRPDSEVAISGGDNHVGGRMSLKLVPGTYTVIVSPRDSVHRLERVDGVVIGEQPRTLRIALRPARLITVLVTATAKPLSRAGVEVIVNSDHAPLNPSSISRDVYRNGPGVPTYPGWRGPVVVAAGRTNDAGSVCLPVRAESMATWVRVRAEGHSPSIVALPSPGANEVHVSLDRGIEVSGRLVPASAAEGYLLRLRSSADPDWFHPSANGVVRIGPNGEFRMTSVPPGSWDLLMTTGAMLRPGAKIGRIQVNAVGPGEPSIIDIRDWLRASLTLTVEWDGDAVPGATIRLLRTPADGLAQHRHDCDGAPGDHRLDLVPGQYSILVDRASVVSGGDPLVAVPGGVVARHIRLAARPRGR